MKQQEEQTKESSLRVAMLPDLSTYDAVFIDSVDIVMCMTRRLILGFMMLLR